MDGWKDSHFNSVVLASKHAGEQNIILVEFVGLNRSGPDSRLWQNGIILREIICFAATKLTKHVYGRLHGCSCTPVFRSWWHCTADLSNQNCFGIFQIVKKLECIDTCYSATEEAFLVITLMVLQHFLFLHISYGDLSCPPNQLHSDG